MNTTSLGEKATCKELQADNVIATLYSSPTIYEGSFDNPNGSGFTYVNGVNRYVGYIKSTAAGTGGFSFTIPFGIPTAFFASRSISYSVNVLDYPSGANVSEVVAYSPYIVSANQVDLNMGTFSGAAGDYTIRIVVIVSNESQ